MLLQMALFHSFQWLSNIPLYICTISSLLSSVNEHLGCFHVLAIVNSAAMNIGVHVSFQISVFIFSEYMPWSGTAGSYSISIFSFVRKLHLFSTVAAPIYNPSNSVGGFHKHFLCTAQSLVHPTFTLPLLQHQERREPLSSWGVCGGGERGRIMEVTSFFVEI